MDAIIALGANLGPRAETIECALGLLEKSLGPLNARSELTETKALVHPDNPDPQPDYLNAVAVFDTALAPEEIISQLLLTEGQLGRVRLAGDKPWSPRVIDLDLIAVGNLTRNTSSLVLPHPRMHQRDFVLIPMLQVAPNWIHPVLGRSTQELYLALNDSAQFKRR